QFDANAVRVIDCLKAIDDERERKIAVAGENAVGVSGEFAGLADQIAKLNVEQIFGAQVGQIAFLAGAAEELKAIEEESQGRAAVCGKERGGRLQVVGVGGLGLEFQSEADAVVSGFLCCLSERNAEAIEILLANGAENVAGDDQGFDSERWAEGQPLFKVLPMF